MKKKSIFISTIAILLAIIIFVPSAQTFAISALSIFRVGETKTITILLSDIEEFANYYKNKYSENDDFDKIMKDKKDDYDDYFENLMKNNGDDSEDYFENLFDKIDADKDFDHKDELAKYKIENLSQFTAFPFKLSKELSTMKHDLYKTDVKTKEFKIETSKINEMLAKSGYLGILSEDYNNENVTINFPSSISAVYDDFIIFATQNINIEASRNLKKDVKNLIINTPGLSENLRTQLENISIDNRDIFLPVITGVGRETDISGNIGYIYSSSDLKTFFEQTSLKYNKEFDNDDFDKNSSVLIWTKDGILYCLAGQKSDSELTSIARGIN